MFKKLMYLVFAFMVVGLIGPVAAQEVDMEIGFATPVIDGQVDEIWAGASTQNMVPLGDPTNASGSWMALYDSENLYVIVDMTDDSLQNDSDGSWQDDSVELYFDGGNTKVNTPLSGDDHQYTFAWTTDEIQGTNIEGATEGIEHAQVDTDTGWRIEIKLPWLSIQGAAPQAGDLIGIDCYYNDDDDGGDSREGKMLTFSTVEGWNDASQWGTAILAAIPEPEPAEPVPVTFGNILDNGGFEDGVMEPWTTYGNVTSEVVTELVDAVIPESPIEGDYCLHVVVPEAGANSWDAGLQNAGHVFEAGKKYTLSAFVKSKAGTLDVHFKPERGADPWEGYSDTTFNLTEEWTEFSVTTPVLTEDVSPGSITFHIAFAAGDFWIDGVRWYEGDYVAPPVTINVGPDGDIAAANELAMPGDTIEIAEGIYVLTSQIELKDNVTYRGAGPGLTIIYGNDVTRAFVAWGDRGATNGQVDADGVGVPNLTGQTGWVLEGLTFTNCVSDAENRQDILSAARDLLTNYTGTPYTLATAQEENGGITNNPEWFDILSGGADDDLTDVELQAYLDANPVGSEGHLVVNDDKRDDGGAVLVLNGADGTIRNCYFSNNSAVGDGGAIMVDGDALLVAIENCTFNLNSCGASGGAVKLSGNESNSTVTGCSFIDCTAGDDGGAIRMDGAGDTGSIYTVTDCTFTGCSATDDGGGILATGDNSSYVWTNCTFTGCYTSDDGAAVKYGPDRADMTMTNCAFIGNGKDPDGTVVTDDGVWQCTNDNAGPITFINCLFADNAVKDDRLVEVKAVFAFQNCTFVNNVVGDKTIIAARGQAWDSTGDEELDVTTDDSVVNNCLFINNTTDGDVVGDNRSGDGLFAVTVTNCLFYGNVDLNGTDPADNVRGAVVEVGTIDVSAVTDTAQIVVDPAGDYRLAAGSPAIDASDPATATATDIEGTAAVGVRDVGAYESAN